MTDNTKPPTLTDATGLGGVIAQDGFDYQLWDGLARLPAWLRNPAFEEMIFEGLEDLEARYFAPHVAPNFKLLDRFQAKSGQLTRKEVGEVFEAFRRFERSYPRLARLQTLVTPRLPTTLQWIARDVDRVRKARPFYAPFPQVTQTSDAKLAADLVSEFGKELGGFVLEEVDVSERVLPDRDSALQAFGVALQKAFPDIDAGPRKIGITFDAMCNLARQRVGQPIKREELVRLLESNLGGEIGDKRLFPLHIRSDHNGVKEDALEIDASAFSGGQRPFPLSIDWTVNLLDPLSRTARWLKARSISRIALSGSFRLSTAFLLGSCLRSAHGFELEIETRSGIWPTDDHPRKDDDYPKWQIVAPKLLYGKRLVVSIGIIRDPRADLLKSKAASEDHILSIILPSAITSAREMQNGVAAVKSAVAAEVSRLSPQGIDMYFVGPAAFAVALGHRWNSMPSTQLHEFIASSRDYVPTALILT